MLELKLVTNFVKDQQIQWLSYIIRTWDNERIRVRLK